MKPNGFWYEVDGDWRRWCSSEMPHWLKDVQLYRLELNGENILQIGDVIHLDAFHSQYAGKFSDKQAGVDWSAVAESYDGIEIAPYLWQRRHDYMWYYGWDCASGCIWRPKGLSLTEESMVAPEEMALPQERLGL